MSDTDKKIANDERERLGLERNKKFSMTKPRAGSPSATSSNQTNQLSKLKETNANYKGTTSGLQTSATTTTSDDIDIEDAGDAFGGKSSKKSKIK